MGILTTDDLGISAPPTPVTSVGELRARLESVSDDTPLVFVAGVAETAAVLTVCDGAMSVIQDFPNRKDERVDSFILTVGVATDDVLGFVFGGLFGGAVLDEDDVTDEVANEQEVAL